MQHPLLNNCTSCGRVICEQEGAGPCHFCGTIVASPADVGALEDLPLGWCGSGRVVILGDTAAGGVYGGRMCWTIRACSKVTGCSVRAHCQHRDG